MNQQSNLKHTKEVANYFKNQNSHKIITSMKTTQAPINGQKTQASKKE